MTITTTTIIIAYSGTREILAHLVIEAFLSSHSRVQVWLGKEVEDSIYHLLAINTETKMSPSMKINNKLHLHHQTGSRSQRSLR